MSFVCFKEKLFLTLDLVIFSYHVHFKHLTGTCYQFGIDMQIKENSNNPFRFNFSNMQVFI